MEERGRLGAVDALRTLSIVAVVAHHYPTRLRAVTVAWLARPIHNGGYAVWIFFTASGYLIASRFVAGERTREFYRRRVARLAPLAAVTVAVLIVARALPRTPIRDTVLGAGPLDRWMLAGVVTATLNLVALAYRHWRPWGLAFGVFWSLSVEEQFYAAFPAIRRRLSPRTQRWLLAALVVAGPLARWLTVTRVRPQLYQVNPLSCFDGIALGVLASMIARPSRRGVALAVAAAGGVALVAVLAQPALRPAITLTWSPSIASLASAAVCWAAPALGTRWWSVATRPGQLCYGLYLLHGPVLLVVWPAMALLPPAAGIAVWLLATTAFAEVSMQFVETPARRKLLALWSGRAPMASGVEQSPP